MINCAMHIIFLSSLLRAVLYRTSIMVKISRFQNKDLKVPLQAFFT